MSALLKHIAKGVSFFDHVNHASKLLALVNTDPLGEVINKDEEFIRHYNEWFRVLNKTTWTMSSLRSALEKLTGTILNAWLPLQKQAMEIQQGRMEVGTVELRGIKVFFIQTYDGKGKPGAPEYFSVPYYGFLCALSQRYNAWDSHSATIWGMRDPDDVVQATEELGKE